MIYIFFSEKIERDKLKTLVMKVSIDKSLCEMCATCVAICPEVFEIKDDGSIDVKDEWKGKDIPAELEEKVKQAQEMCPKSAIVEG